MRQQPRGREFKKPSKGAISRVVKRQELVRGSIGIRVLEPGRLTLRQLNAVERTVVRALAVDGFRVNLCVSPDRPVTAKPVEVRRGKGKGSVAYWSAQVRAGTIIREVVGPGAITDKVRVALKEAGGKMPRLWSLVEARRGLSEK